MRGFHQLSLANSFYRCASTLSLSHIQGESALDVRVMLVDFEFVLAEKLVLDEIIASVWLRSAGCCSDLYDLAR